MLKLKEIYALRSQPRPLTEWVMRDNWFPELQYGTVTNSALLEVLEQEKRILVLELANPYIDGHRIAQLHTVWFDHRPVFIVQDAGRGGDDHHKRWVTDAKRYGELVAYLMLKASVSGETSDIVDGDKLVYEEEVLSFYGHDFREKFGFDTEPRAEGYCLMPHATSIVPGCDPDQVLVMLARSVHTPAAFIRRNECVLRLERALTPVELAANPRLTESLAGSVFDRYVWYRPCDRPDDAPVLAV